MLDSLLQLIHVLASMVWLGRNVLCPFLPRPAAQQLEPPCASDCCAVLQRFLRQ